MPEPIANADVLVKLRRLESNLDADKQWYRKKFAVQAELLKELQTKFAALEKALLDEKIAAAAAPKRVRVS